MFAPNSLSVCQASEFSDHYSHYCNKTLGEVNSRIVWNFKDVNKTATEVRQEEIYSHLRTFDSLRGATICS